MKAVHATELDELRAWVESVRLLPRFLRTRDAGAVLDGLVAAGVNTGADLQDGTSLDDLARGLGSTREALMASLRKCPFGL